MKILSLLFCFMFVDYFSIFYLNILWSFLWLHLVTSDCTFLISPSPATAGNTLPCSFFSGLLQAWLTPTHLLRVHVCVTCPDSIALGYMPLLWAPMGAVLTVSVYSLPILWLLILFPHRFMSPWRGQVVSFCEAPSTGLVIMNACWMNVQTPSDWPRMFASVTLILPLLERVKWWWNLWSWCRGRPLGVHYANVSMMWGIVYFNLCLLPRKGPLTWGTEFMSCMLMLLLNPISYFLF